MFALEANPGLYVNYILVKLKSKKKKEFYFPILERSKNKQ